jgi:hypothetical protein
MMNMKGLIFMLNFSLLPICTFIEKSNLVANAASHLHTVGTVSKNIWRGSEDSAESYLYVRSYLGQFRSSDRRVITNCKIIFTVYTALIALRVD